MQSLANAMQNSMNNLKTRDMGRGADSITIKLVDDINQNRFAEAAVNEKGELAVSAVDPRIALSNQMVRGLSESILATLIRDVMAKAMAVKEKGQGPMSQQMMVDCLVIVMMARDIDEGKGERKIAYDALFELYMEYFPETVKAIIHLLPEKYGSWKDVNNILSMLFDKIKSSSTGAFRQNPKLTAYKDLMKYLVKMYADQLEDDLSSDSPSLAGKWAPREARNGNTKHLARYIAIQMYRGESFTRQDGSVIKSFDENSEALKTDPTSHVLKKNLESSKVACYAAYRKATSTLNSSTEVLMCDSSGRWSEIKPGSVPAKCLKKHRKAFYNESRKKGDHHPRSMNADRIQCAKQFSEYISKCLNDPSKARVHGKKLMPHEIVSHYLRGGAYDEVLEAQWIDMVESLREAGTFNDLLPLVDVSGSMGGLPMEVAIAIGLLIATLSPLSEGYFITFESKCRWHKVTGKTLQDKVICARNAPWGGSTNFESAMNLVLSTCQKNNLSPEEVAKLRLIVLSDMEFDMANGSSYYGGSYNYGYPYGRTTPSHNTWTSAYEKIKAGFEKAGRASKYAQAYSVPEIWFWNLRASSLTFPVKDNVPGAFLISGWSQNALKSMMKGDLRSCKDEAPPTAYDLLRKEIDSDRYDPVRKVVEIVQEGHFSGYKMPVSSDDDDKPSDSSEIKSSTVSPSSEIKDIPNTVPPPPSPVVDDDKQGWVDVGDSDDLVSQIKTLKAEMESMKLAHQIQIDTLELQKAQANLEVKKANLDKLKLDSVGCSNK